MKLVIDSERIFKVAETCSPQIRGILRDLFPECFTPV